MYGVLRHTGLGALSFFLGYILECRISAMPKIFLIVWFKIDYEIYLLTNKNQENREEQKRNAFPFFSLFIFVSPSRVFLSTVPCLCLVVLCAHRALPGSFDI
jgi:hypothetical protein